MKLLRRTRMRNRSGMRRVSAHGARLEPVTFSQRQFVKPPYGTQPRGDTPLSLGLPINTQSRSRLVSLICTGGLGGTSPTTIGPPGSEKICNSDYGAEDRRGHFFFALCPVRLSTRYRPVSVRFCSAAFCWAALAFSVGVTRKMYLSVFNFLPLAGMYTVHRFTHIPQKV